jgi:hypothetical protein
MTSTAIFALWALGCALLLAALAGRSYQARTKKGK